MQKYFIEGVSDKKIVWYLPLKMMFRVRRASGVPVSLKIVNHRIPEEAGS